MKHAQHTDRRTLLILALAVLSVAAAGCGRQQSQARTSTGRRGVPRAHQPLTAQTCPPVYLTASPEIPVTPWQTVAGKTVILDAGHGGHDEGTSHFGLREKDINLDLALRTAQLLRARGANVVMTRSSDVFISLPERSAIANRNPNATFVSVHVNASATNPAATGVETFVLSKEHTDEDRGRTVASKFTMNGGNSVQGTQALANLAVRSRSRGPALADCLQRSLTGRLGEVNRGVKGGNLAVLRETYFGPAALVEVGFLTNPRTAERMRGEEWRRRTAEALCEGICEFLQRPE